METETDKIFKEQLRKLPTEVVDFISSTNWDEDLDEIGSLYNLPKEELAGFTREATLVVMGLVHPDEFYDSLKKEVGIQGPVLEALVANVEKKIFSPIRPALIEFLEKETAKEVLQTPVLIVPKAPPVSLDVAPDNLPTGETESFLPNLAPKTSTGAEGEVHPFEEKMKRVFTAGQQSMGDLAIEPAPQAPVAQSPKAPPTPQADPYREAIE